MKIDNLINVKKSFNGLVYIKALIEGENSMFLTWLLFPMQVAFQPP